MGRSSGFIHYCLSDASGLDAVIYLSRPNDEKLFLQTEELQAWFAGNTSDQAWFPLDAVESLIGKVLLTKARGSVASLVSHNQERRWSRNQSRGGTYVWPKFGFDPDADLYGVAWITTHPTLETSLILWNTLLRFPGQIRGKWLSSTNQNFTAKRTNDEEGFSPLGCAVTGHNRWLPKNDETGFFAPSQVYLTDLPDDFEQDTDRSHALARALGMKQPVDLAPVAAVLGMTQEQLELRRTLSDEEVEDTLRRREARQEFPEKVSPSPERRLQKVKAEAREAPRKSSSRKVHSSRDDYEQEKERAKQYLRGQYHADEWVICQLSHDPMPFKVVGRDDWYFEAVECVADTEKFYRQNYLALSPHFAAMFRYANHDRDRMRELVLSASGRDVNIRLADETYTLKFTSEHIRELKAVLEVEAEA